VAGPLPACGGHTTSTSSSDDGHCTYLDLQNRYECPAQYDHTGSGPCAPIGLQCQYPGAGDADSKGCYSTAIMLCRADGDGGGADGDPKTGRWAIAQ
jgi:hypothetical protein